MSTFFPEADPPKANLLLSHYSFHSPKQLHSQCILTHPFNHRVSVQRTNEKTQATVLLILLRHSHPRRRDRYKSSSQLPIHPLSRQHLQPHPCRTRTTITPMSRCRSFSPPRSCRISATVQMVHVACACPRGGPKDCGFSCLLVVPCQT